MPLRCRRVEEAILIQVADYVVDAVALGGAQQLLKFLLVFSLSIVYKIIKFPLDVSNRDKVLCVRNLQFLQMMVLL